MLHSRSAADDQDPAIYGNGQEWLLLAKADAST